MFRWCSYCQHFMGESAPFDRYSVTHGICVACESSVLQNEYQLSSSVLIAQKIFQELFSLKRRGEFSLPDDLIQQALDAGVKPSELVMGVLQPVLYWVGVQWEQGLITPAEEHEFSAWCEGVLDRFSSRSPEEVASKIVLTTMSGNTHNIGVRFLAAYLQDRGISCRVIAPSLPDAELLERCVRTQPAYCGISVALPEGIGRAKSLATKIGIETNGHTKPFLGGFAFRQTSTADCDIPILNTLDGVVNFLTSTA